MTNLFNSIRNVFGKREPKPQVIPTKKKSIFEKLNEHLKDKKRESKKSYLRRLMERRVNTSKSPNRSIRRFRLLRSGGRSKFQQEIYKLTHKRPAPVHGEKKVKKGKRRMIYTYDMGKLVGRRPLGLDASRYPVDENGMPVW